MGKCASKERGAGPLRPSRLPAVPRPSDCFKSPTAPKTSKLPSVSRETFISQKEEFQNVPEKSPLKNEDEDGGIDTNVIFNQQEVASQSGRMLLGPSRSTSELLSAYNTAHPSPARSFSSGGHSPDTLYNSASEDLQDYLASPIRPSGALLPNYPKFNVDSGRAGYDQPSATPPKPSFYDPNSDDDLFPAQDSSNHVPLEESRQSDVGSKKRLEGSSHSELRNLASISSLPLPVSQVEDRSLLTPTLTIQKSDAITPTVDVSRQYNSVAFPVVQKPKSTIADRSVSISAIPSELRTTDFPSEKYSRHLAPSVSLPTRVENRTSLVSATSSKTDLLNHSDGGADFGGKWELLSREPLRNTSSELTDLPVSSTRDPEKYKGPKQELQRRAQAPLSGANSDGEADLVRSSGSNQSDDIETLDVEGDGEGYVLLGVQPQELASPGNVSIEEAAKHKEHADKGLHVLEVEQKALPLENHSNEAAVKPWPPIVEKAAEATIRVEEGGAPVYLVEESSADKESKEADVAPTVAKDESWALDAGGEENLVKEPTEATMELDNPIQEKTMEATPHMEKEAHAESTEEAPLEEMKEKEVGYKGAEKDYLGPTKVEREVAPTQETPLDTSLEHETKPYKEEKAPHMDGGAPAQEVEETLLQVHPTEEATKLEEASPMAVDKEVGPPGVGEDASPTKITMKQETLVAEDMEAESPTSEGYRNTDDNGVKVIPNEESHIVKVSEASVPEKEAGASPTIAEGDDKEEHIQSLWNLKHLKKQPSIGQPIKSKQASQQVKEKVPKVLGLPWPPAPLGSE